MLIFKIQIFGFLKTSTIKKDEELLIDIIYSFD